MVDVDEVGTAGPPAGGGRGVLPPLVAETCLGLLLITMVVRIVGSIANGIGAVTQSPQLPDQSLRLGERLAAFGNAGDGQGALLLLAAVGLLGWHLQLCASHRTGGAAWLDRALPQPQAIDRLLVGRRIRQALGWLFVPIVASTLAATVGEVIFYDGGQGGWWHATGAGLILGGYLIVEAAAGYGLWHLGWAQDEAIASCPDPDEPDGWQGGVIDPGSAVFVVQDSDGGVTLHPGLAEAAEAVAPIGVMQGAVSFFTGDGDRLEATLVDGQVQLRRTGTLQPQLLVDRLASYCEQAGIEIRPGHRDQLSVYAQAIGDRQLWLDLAGRPRWLTSRQWRNRPRYTPDGD